MRRPVEEQLCWEMIVPKVSVTYLPGPAVAKEHLEKALKKLIEGRQNNSEDKMVN